MTARQGKWRVTVRNFSTMETGAVTNIYEFDSFDAALEYACEKRKILHHTVTVMGPDGHAGEQVGWLIARVIRAAKGRNDYENANVYRQKQTGLV